jgi:metallophosphoesterase (TIGR03767 family)
LGFGGWEPLDGETGDMRSLRAAITLGIIAGLAGSFTGTSAAIPNTLGKSTAQQRVVPTGSDSFVTLTLGPGEPYVVRQDLAPAGSKRAKKRRSLAYFGQLSDFQLADEESPGRVEFLDPPNGTQFPFDAAWRPWEALEPQIDDAAIRQLNAFAAASPTPQGNGARRKMDFALDTGDSADSQQLNETEWVRTLLEGGTLDPNSGINPVGYLHQLCPAVGVPGAAEAARYTGVQDFRDYVEGTQPSYYDPGDVRGFFAGWPSYPGLMDRAQQPFTAAGVRVPTYVVFGNHDGLVQGNQAANRSFEDVTTGCLKPMAPVPNQTDLGGVLRSVTPANVLAMLATDPDSVALVPPDPRRRYVSKSQYKRIFESGSQSDGHGFAYVDPAEQAASSGAAGYYSWSPVPGFRFVALDTVSEGGVAGPSADGNLDDPQFNWLRSQLEAATAADQLVVIFSHHAIPSLTSQVPDEAAPPCTGIEDAHGHDQNPGCDLDPRDSSPIHLGQDLVDLLHQYPHAIAWVAGHSHVNDIEAYPGPNATGFWSIRTAAEADWPQQNRLLEVMDNRDGTLSIFGTILDHASAATAPPSGTAATGLTPTDMASIGRTLSYNDPQVGATRCSPACGEGNGDDRNAELLIRDPRG